MKECDLLVVGNGYDLALGYKTKYEDFLQNIKKALSFESFAEYCNNLKENEQYLKNDVFFDKCCKNKNNYFIKYLFAKNEALKNWSDVETELASILKSFDKCFGDIKSYQGQEFVLRTDAINSESIFEIITNDIWYKIECRKYNDSAYLIEDMNFNPVSNVNYFYDRIEEFKKKFVDLLYKDFENVKDLLCQYLLLVSNDNTNKSKFDLQTKKIISYNYTKIAQIANEKRDAEVNYIHGNIDRGIVLGIDPSIQFNYERFSKFDKTIQRVTLNNYCSSLKNFINTSQRIVYIGLSFDSNDETSLSILLSNDKLCHIIVYKDKEDLNDKTVNIKKLLGYKKFTDMINSKTIYFISNDSIVSN